MAAGCKVSQVAAPAAAAAADVLYFLEQPKPHSLRTRFATTDVANAFFSTLERLTESLHSYETMAHFNSFVPSFDLTYLK